MQPPKQTIGPPKTRPYRSCSPPNCSSAATERANAARRCSSPKTRPSRSCSYPNCPFHSDGTGGMPTRRCSSPKTRPSRSCSYPDCPSAATERANARTQMQLSKTRPSRSCSPSNRRFRSDGTGECPRADAALLKSRPSRSCSYPNCPSAATERANARYFLMMRMFPSRICASAGSIPSSRPISKGSRSPPFSTSVIPGLCFFRASPSSASITTGTSFLPAGQPKRHLARQSKLAAAAVQTTEAPPPCILSHLSSSPAFR